MPDALCSPATAFGPEVRRIVAANPWKPLRLRPLALTGIAVSLLAVAACWRMPILLVWNASASVPTGLYRVEPRARVRRGDLVIVRLPRTLRSLAAARHYLPANVPLVKRVAAVEGDRICARGNAITINGSRAATRLERDSLGRPMPRWNGCRTLEPGEYLLLGDDPGSFDGRYFGVTASGAIAGRAWLLWQA